jgi:pilus assembly protein CpaC
MKPRRAAASKIVALIVYIIVILVATPQAQQPVSFTGSPGAITAGPAVTATDATGIDLLVGRSTILNVGSAITRVSLTVPDVADAMVTAPQQLLIHGKAPGVISMFVWDRAGGIKTYEVNVRRDLTQLIEQMRNLFPGEAVSVVGSGKDVVLSGTVSSKYVIDKAAEVAGGYVEKKENVVNLLKQQEGVASNQVLLRVRFAEVSRSALQELGASFIANGYQNDWFGRTTTQQFAAPDFDSSTPGGLTFSDFLNLFLFNTKHNVGAVVRALQNKGLFQSLAEPNLIALNGKEASFLAGGEYPYPVVQPGGGGASVTIMFKEFGVRLNFTPTVLGGDLINLKVRPEVSSLDFSNAITLEGFRVPALATRRTETEVELQDGQTFAIAGLMNNTMNSSMQKIPGIGDIPILGYLFKSRAYQKNQTELVVMITPQIVRKGSTGVSEGLPTLVEPFLGAPSKPLPPPAPYVGSPRYPAGGAAPTAQPPRNDNHNDAAAVAPAPSRMAQPAADQKAVTERKPADKKAATATPMLHTTAVPKPSKAEAKALENQRRQAEETAKAKAEQDRKDAEAKAAQDRKDAEERAAQERKDAEAKKVADQKASEERARQEKLDQERARREAEVAKKNSGAERQKQAEAKKREKSLAEAAEHLRQAQAAYQAEIDKAKGGKGGSPEN